MGNSLISSSDKTDYTVMTQLTIRSIIYIIVGIIVVVFNMLGIFTFLSSKGFRRRFTIYIYLCSTEIVNGVSLIVCGIGREYLIQSNQYFFPISASDCLFTMPWPFLMLLAGTLPASANFILSLNRLFAIRFSTSYNKWKNKQKIILIAGSLMFSGIMVLAAILTRTDSIMNPDKMCALMNIDKYYGTVHYLLICCLYIISFVIVIYVNQFANQYKNQNAIDRRIQRTSIVLIGTGVLFVSIPSIVLILDGWNAPNISEIVVGIVYWLYGIQSCLCVLVFILFRPEFRIRLFLTLRFWKRRGVHFDTTLSSRLEPINDTNGKIFRKVINSFRGEADHAPA